MSVGNNIPILIIFWFRSGMDVPETFGGVQCRLKHRIWRILYSIGSQMLAVGENFENVYIYYWFQSAFRNLVINLPCLENAKSAWERLSEMQRVPAWLGLQVWFYGHVPSVSASTWPWPLISMWRLGTCYLLQFEWITVSHNTVIAGIWGRRKDQYHIITFILYIY